MKRVTFFAHYDGQNEVKPYILLLLKHLRELSDEVIFISTSPLAECELEKVRVYCAQTALVDNAGYDFGMWQHALKLIDLCECDELVLTNSSIFGPIFPLAPIFERMAENPCDFWGMTDSFMLRWHIQSYFIVFKQKALHSAAFKQFFDSVLPYRDKFQLIRSYEVGFAQYLYENGLRPATFVPFGGWLKTPRRLSLLRRKRQNITLQYPMELIKLGMPFVKVQLLRDNPQKVPIKPVIRAMQEHGYDLSLVQFARDASAKPTFAEAIRRPFVSALDAIARSEMPEIGKGH